MSKKFLMTSSVVLLILSVLAGQGSAALQKNSAFKAFYWTQASDTGVKNGCYGYHQIDSSVTSGTTTRYSSTFWFLYRWWFDRFQAVYPQTVLLTHKGKPAKISRAPAHLDTVEWTTGFLRSNSPDSMKFFFPLLSQKANFGRYDYFTVDVDSITDLEFYGAGDSIMVGTFVHKKPDSRGAVNILARNAFIIELTNANPLRIKSIRCNGTYDSIISRYLGYSLETFSKTAAWYGFDILDTSLNVPKIIVHSVALSGTSPYTATDAPKISWKLQHPEIVDSCVIYASFDNRKTWVRSNKTSADSSYTWTIPKQSTDSAFIKIAAFGKSGESVSSISSRFSIQEKTRFTLSVQSYADNQVIARWNPEALTIANRKNVWIAYKPGSIVTSVSTTGIDTIKYSLTQNLDTITGLSESGTYYFTAFVQDEAGKFTIANDDAIDSAVAKDLTPPDNNYKLDTTAVDSTFIVLRWATDGAVNPDIDSIAIWYNKTNTPDLKNSAASTRIAMVKAGNSSDTLKKLAPDKLYYFALFAKDKNGNWSTAPEKAQLTVRTKPVKPGVITGIADTIYKNDTLKLFSDSVRIWSKDIETFYVDTIDRWEAPPLHGFIPSGPEYSFRYGRPPAGTGLFFTVTYDEPDSPYTENDILLYTFNTGNGTWELTDAELTRNTKNNTITFRTENLRAPALLMIDTLPPTLSETRKDTSAKVADKPIEATFLLEDNITNPEIRLLAGTGSSEYNEINDSYLDKIEKDGSYRYNIPAFAANGCSGHRALVIASDGRTSDTLNMSRSILRSEKDNCDDIVASDSEWTPLHVTAYSTNNTIEKLMASATGKKFTHDIRNELIIKWLPNDSNKSTPEDKWVEYGDADPDAYQLKPGSLVWIKSSQVRKVSYGEARVPALTDTFTINLKKGEWTDFSLPYNFDIYSGDIMKATGAPQSLYLYKWEDSMTTHITRPVFLSGIQALSRPDSIFQAAGIFTALNESSKDITLRIPPISTSLSTILATRGTGKKTSGSDQWFVKVNFTDNNGAAFASSYIAQTPIDGQPQWYPLSPTFSKVSASIINPVNGNSYGHTASADVTDEGELYPILCENSSKQPENIAASVAATHALPTGILAKLYIKNERSTTQPSESFSVLLPPQQKSTGYLIVGTSAFISSVIAKLNAKFSFIPFTFNNLLKIHYTLPVDVKQLSVSIYDLKGRRLENVLQTANINPGQGSLFLNRNFATGYYVVQMQLKIAGKNEPLVMNKKWMCVR